MGRVECFSVAFEATIQLKGSGLIVPLIELLSNETDDNRWIGPGSGGMNKREVIYL